MEDLNITLIQMMLAWEDKEANLASLQNLLSGIKHQPDLVLLPEMFSTGFSMKPELFSEEMEGPTVNWMKEMATCLGSVISGTLMIREEGHFYNRSVWVFPDGTTGFYDKHHLFRMGNEQVHFSQGNHRNTFRIKDWNILPLTCYDLRFPIWSMNHYHNGTYCFDLICYLANWPATRSHHWKSLLVARAIENQAYVAGVNRTGQDGIGTPHDGFSMVVDPFGEILADAGQRSCKVLYATLDRHKLDQYRKRFFIAPDWEAPSI